MELKIQTRNIFGRKTKILRKQGLIPAELYGHKIKNLHLSISSKEFQKVFEKAGESTIINLELNKNEKLPVMIHDIQVEPLSGEILNIDFYQVRMDEKVRLSIPVEFIGEAPAVKNFGGILIKTLQSIEIESLPKDIPHYIEVNLSGLDEVGKSISVRDLNLGSQIKVLVEPETIIATVIEKTEEEIAVPPAGGTVETAPTPETSAGNTTASHSSVGGSGAKTTEETAK